ncbi:Aquaporin-9 [Halotydeus destructor]|nr:Aquaporin-9 [Halotydeus destructor]
MPKKVPSPPSAHRIENPTSGDQLQWFLGEGIGTFVYVFIGTCIEAAFAINRSGGARSNLEDHFPFLGWGLALTLSYLISGGITGGHFNGSVTFTYRTLSKMRDRMLTYLLAQILGALIGSSLAYALYKEAIVARFGQNFKDSTEAIAIAAPLAKTGVGITTIAGSSVLATGFYVIILMAITDKRNLVVPKPLYPLFIGLTNLSLVLFALSPAWIGTVIINPTADLSARVVSYLCYGVPLLELEWAMLGTVYTASTFAAVLAGLLYVFFVEYQWDQAWPKPPAPVGRFPCSLQPEEDLDILRVEPMP